MLVAGVEARQEAAIALVDLVACLRVVDVVEAMGDSPDATRAIWRYLLDIDWMARVKAWLLPVDHPLLLLVAEPRRLRASVRDGLWVRLVDVGAALAARSYAASGSVVVEIADGFCPWNQGRWRVGAGGVERTDDSPELSCDVTALGSVYLGGFTWAQLGRALRVAELRQGRSRAPTRCSAPTSLHGARKSSEESREMTALTSVDGALTQGAPTSSSWG